MLGVSVFGHGAAAARYARHRPYFHPLVVRKAAERLAPERPVPRALDVGCGTGQSTLALREIAVRVVGVDVSPAMLAEAAREGGIDYVQGAAERLPFAAGRFNLATVGLALHWLDRASFLDEARRVLTPGGWLVIYGNGFLGTMREQPGFAGWWRERYLARYPSPPRGGASITSDEAEAHGFRSVGDERYVNDVAFSVDDLVGYLLTQSNVIAAVEEGTERVEDVGRWLETELAPFFATGTGTFGFGGSIRYLQLQAVDGEFPGGVDAAR